MLCRPVLGLFSVVALVLGLPALLPGDEVPYLDPAGVKGPLVIAGGGELPAPILERFVKLAGGKEALLVIIPTAGEQADKQLSREAEKAKLLQPWVDLGVERVHIMHTRSRAKANDAAF